jgi:hypothetical protein
VPPIRFLQPPTLAVLEDLGKVELGRVPAADAVVGAKVPFALEAERRRTVPLKMKRDGFPKRFRILVQDECTKVSSMNLKFVAPPSH